MGESQVKVLLVDDDEDDYVVTRDLLNESDRHAFNLTWKNNYDSALAVMAVETFDVCLVDYRLGSHTGLDLLTEAVRRGVSAPIILLTGQAEREIDFQAMKAGAADFLVKSQLTSSMLERSIRYAIKDHETLEALRTSEERYALASLGASDGLWDWIITKDETFYSSRWKSMLGYEEAEIGNLPEEWFSRIHADDYPGFRRELNLHLEGNTPHFQHEHRMQHADGEYRWILSRGIAVRDASGIVYRMAGSQTDITDRRKTEDRLLHEATHDHLTALPNRTAIMDRLRRSIERNRYDKNYTFAILYLDLDRFKIINDSLGHQSGDQLLIEMARRLELVIRPSDMVARLGGDEFVLLLDQLDQSSDAAYVAKRVLSSIATPLMIDDREVFTTASIGIALCDGDCNTAEDLLRDADTAMYRAKNKGKARYEFFDLTMRENAIRIMQLESDLHQAIANKEFVLFYQPIVSLDTHKLLGFEALIRWDKAGRGIIGPGEFVQFAEDNGLINPIGRWVLHESCRQMQEWQETFLNSTPLSMSVNISGKQFSQPNFPIEVASILEETRLDPTMLKLEITESVIMENADSVAEMLAEIKGLGSKISIDDFGTGYSSFSHLHKFPIDTLKIDRTFVSRLDTSSENTEIVRAILMLAHNLKMDVVAEGVETIEQADLLHEMGCDFAQGYYFGKPMNALDAAKYINKELNLIHVARSGGAS
jgi:diguanylate cyclase (GGDEF)-like protein/PAS domain S-box-containing protein